MGFGVSGNQLRQRGFSTAGWPPQDHRGQPICFDCVSERSILADHVLLSHEIVERLWAHPLRQRSIYRMRSLRCVKQIRRGFAILVHIDSLRSEFYTPLLVVSNALLTLPTTDATKAVKETREDSGQWHYSRVRR